MLFYGRSPARCPRLVLEVKCSTRVVFELPDTSPTLCSSPNLLLLCPPLHNHKKKKKNPMSCNDFLTCFKQGHWLFSEHISCVWWPPVLHLQHPEPESWSVWQTDSAPCTQRPIMTFCICAPSYITHKGAQVFLILIMQYCISHFERFSLKSRVYRIL